MSQEAREILKILKNQLGAEELIAAIITSVDKTTATCTIEYDEMEIGGVRLQSIVDDNVKGVKFFPKVGSVVLVEKLSDKGEMFIVMMSEVEEVNISIETTLFKQDLNGFQIKKGDDSLKEILSLIVEATTQIAVVIGNNPDYGKLIKAQTKIENLLK